MARRVVPTAFPTDPQLTTPDELGAAVRAARTAGGLTLEEAALNLGASRLAVLWTITLPYLRPSMIGAAAMAFRMSFENFTTTLMLVGSDSPLTVLMYGRMREGATPVLNAVSLFLMVASALLAVLLMWRSGREQRPESA